MKDRRVIQSRFMQDSLAVRLGGLAANLSRMKSFAGHDANSAAVESMVEESKYFIEWIVPEMEVDKAAVLVEMQVELARWQRRWGEVWNDKKYRLQAAEQSGKWSQHVLELSGLLD